MCVLRKRGLPSTGETPVLPVLRFFAERKDISSYYRTQGEQASRLFGSWKSTGNAVPHTGETPVLPGQRAALATLWETPRAHNRWLSREPAVKSSTRWSAPDNGPS